MGSRYASEGLVNLQKMALELEEKYGIDARIQFESGIAMVIPSYSNLMIDQISKQELENGASKDYGVKNTRNNSYFGSRGAGVQYVTRSDGTEVYNEPKRRKK